MNNLVHFTALITTFLLINSCGGGGSTSTVTNPTASQSNIVTGNFRDTTVIGLEYNSTSYNGITGTNGTYTCKKDENITFSLGNIHLGTILCDSLITPLSLITDSNISSSTVTNMVQFLTMLDNDSDLSNGIFIEDYVRQLAQNWSSLNFALANFDTQQNLLDIINEINNNVNTVTPHTLVSDAVAKAHLQETLYCAYAGVYKGTYSGSDTGKFGAVVSPLDGKMTIIGYSDGLSETFYGNGAQGFTLDSTRNITGTTTTGTTFTGKIKTANTVEGTWARFILSGTFNGHRLGGANDAKFRFVGEYHGLYTGILSFDIASNNTVVGIDYRADTGIVYQLSGNVVGNALTLSAQNGLTIHADIDLVSSALSNGTSTAYTIFSGYGCKLN